MSEFLHPVEQRAVPKDTIYFSFGGFYESIGNNSYLLILVDDFTKFFLTKPTQILKVRDVIRNMWRIRVPKDISDRGLAVINGSLENL